MDPQYSGPLPLRTHYDRQDSLKRKLLHVPEKWDYYFLLIPFFISEGASVMELAQVFGLNCLWVDAYVPVSTVQHTCVHAHIHTYVRSSARVHSYF